MTCCQVVHLAIRHRPVASVLGGFLLVVVVQQFEQLQLKILNTLPLGFNVQFPL